MRTMMALGAYRFGLTTAAYQELERRSAYRWESQARIGRHPVLQFVGEGHTDITLRGIIYPYFRGGLGQVDRLRAQAGQGVPLPLISGLGRVIGLFAVMRLDDVETYFTSGGSPRKIEFTIELKSYGADR